MRQRAKNAEGSETIPVTTRLSNFLQKHRRILAILLACGAVVVIAVFVGLSIRNQIIEKSYVATEDLQAQYDEWTGLSDEEKADQYDALAAEAASVLDRYGKYYAGARSLMIDGSALYELERYGEAADRYAEVADRFPESYLAPISLLRASVAAEEAGDLERALTLLQQLVDNYEGTSPDAPRALFSIGRLYETLDNVAEAAFYYNELIDSYPSSSWTNLARTRIITLTAQGRIGG